MTSEDDDDLTTEKDDKEENFMTEEESEEENLINAESSSKEITFKCAKSAFIEETHSASKKATCANMNFVTHPPSAEDKIKPLPSKVSSSYRSCSTITSALVAFNLASNAASHSSFRPKRR